MVRLTHHPLVRCAMLVCGLVAAMTLPLGCGGGGGGGSAAPPPPVGGGSTPPTYQKRTLPGRLIVNGPSSAQVFDLGTGAATTLPKSGASNYHDRWEVRAGPALLVRVNDRLDAGHTQVSYLDGASLQSAAADTVLGNDPAQALLSPDGRHLLAYWYDDAGGETVLDRTITVFDRSGAIVKRHAQPSAYFEPYALDWLPDGRYVYLDGKRLMVSSPGALTATTAATLSQLPDADAGASSLAASPDGQRIVFAWHEGSGDQYLWTVGLDGGGLRRLTRAPAGQETSPLEFRHGGPVWSPDGAWIAAAFNLRGTTTAPVFPDDPFTGAKITGTTGCNDQVVVLPADGQDIALSWPDWDVTHGVKVRPAGSGAQVWLSICGAVVDLPLSWVR